MSEENSNDQALSVINASVSEPIVLTPMNGFQSKVQLPYLLDGEFFVPVHGDDGNASSSISVQCLSCPDRKVLKGSRTSTGNLLKHIKNSHPIVLKQLEVKKAAKRKNADSNVELSKRICSHHLNKDEVGEVVMYYIISEMRPIFTVEKPSFRGMVKRLSGGVEPPYATCFKGKLAEKKRDMEYNLRVKFSEVDFVCTTADIWSSNHKSFMGVTGHYLDPYTLKRVSVLLACQRMKFKHTFSEISSVLFSVYSNYDLYVPKLVGTVTDNASNFGKAFKVFSVPDNVSEEDASFMDDAYQKTIGVEAFPDCTLDSSLPTHYKCFAHSLNLVVTTDAEKA